MGSVGKDLMRISDKGIDVLVQLEGVRFKPYKAHQDEEYLTIGIGHYGPDVSYDMEITENDAKILLREDIKKFESVINELVIVPLNQNEFDALVIFVFNIGETEFKKSTLLKLLNNGDYDKAAEQFLRWHYVKGVHVEGLLNRQKKTKEIFLIGKYGD